MHERFFKVRKQFDLNPNKYDLGTFFPKKSHSDKLFLKLIRNLEGKEYKELYERHKNHYLQSEPGAEEKMFFKELNDYVNRVIDKEKKKEHLWSHDKRNCEVRILKYESFLEMMEEKDNWKILKPDSETEQIKLLMSEIKQLKVELSKYRVKPEHKIEIVDDKETIIDLFHQIQTLKNGDPDRKDKDLLRTHSQNTWAKILANYFTVGNKEISFHTVKKQFQIDDIGKYTENSRYRIKIEQE